MSFIRDKEKSLQQLRRFCTQSKIVGWCSNMWFGGLVQSYPLHFLFYTQYSTYFKGSKEAAKKFLQDKFHYRLEHLLQLPIEETDINTIEEMLEKLDTLVNEKKKQRDN